MRRLFSMLLLAAPLTLLAQGGGKFRITGKIKGFQEKLIYLAYMKNGEKVVDSCPVRDGSYRFEGTLSESGGGILADTNLRGPIYPNNGCEVYMMPESFAITHVDSFSNSIASGSQANIELVEQRNAMKPFSAAMHPLYKQYDSAEKAGNATLKGIIDKRIDSIYGVAKEQIYGNYVRKQPKGPLALRSLQYYAGAEIDPKVVQPLFASLPEAVRNSAEGRSFLARIESVDKTAIGKEAIDFTQNDTAGLPVKLSAFRGKYVLLDFWASWCAPCRAENPNVVKAYGQYHPKGLEILSVSLDKAGDKDKWMKAIHDDSLIWTHVSDLQFWNNAVAKTYGIMGVPANYLIDPQGRIVAKNLRGEELEKKLKEIFNP